MWFSHLVVVPSPYPTERILLLGQWRPRVLATAVHLQCKSTATSLQHHPPASQHTSEGSHRQCWYFPPQSALGCLSFLFFPWGGWETTLYPEQWAILALQAFLTTLSPLHQIK